MRVFLDTNVLVSAFTARGLSADVVRLVLTEHELLTGEVNLVELRRVMRDRLGVPAAIVGEVEGLLREQTVIPRPESPGPIEVRDADDQWVLASALAGGADVLVTGDQDLLDVRSRSSIPILTPRGFWERLRRGR